AAVAHPRHAPRPSPGAPPPALPRQSHARECRDRRGGVGIACDADRKRRCRLGRRGRSLNPPRRSIWSALSWLGAEAGVAESGRRGGFRSHWAFWPLEVRVLSPAPILPACFSEET